MSIEQVIERVRAYRRSRKWTINKFATKAGVTESTLRKIDDPEWNPERKTLARLEAVIAEEERAS